MCKLNRNEAGRNNGNETPCRIATGYTVSADCPKVPGEAAVATQGQQCPYKATDVQRCMATKGSWVLGTHYSNQGPPEPPQA